MQSSDPCVKIIHRIVEKDPRFPRGAYFFMQEAVSYTLDSLSKDKKRRQRHISGQQLCEGIRKYLLNQFGPMAIDVLGEWRITSTRDFGIIVFNMVKHNVLSARKEDSVDDFDDVYDFYQEFVLPHIPDNKRVKTPVIA